MPNIKYPEWTLIPWDGNPALGHQCWRKSFFGGKVSVGVGDFHLVVFSYGPHCEASFSSTRWRQDRIISEQEMMDALDAHAISTWKPDRFIWREFKLK